MSVPAVCALMPEDKHVRLPDMRITPVRLAVIFLLLLSYFTYVHGYWQPKALFWDENYHIASAQKYLNGTFFMEPHPPLGKLLIAAGEALVDANAVDDQFIDTDYAKNPPDGFSFAGYRLFPTLLAWLTVPLLFWIFLLLTRNTLWSTLFTFPYIFDNALLVHSRSAMLDSTMVFFATLMILAFLLLREWKEDRKKFAQASILFGAAFGLLLATKAFGLLLILLIPFLAWELRARPSQLLRFGWIAAIAFLIPFCTVWQIHFSLARTINPALPDQGYYQASPWYKELIQRGKTSSIFAFPVMLRDSMNFVGHYQKGVPRLNLAKSDENGSPWFLWPIGARTINYRWETPDGRGYGYLYLQSNPVIWLLTFAGVLTAFALLLSSVFFPFREPLKHRFLLFTFSTLYVCFFITVSQIDRVLYLYHYFLPLILGFLLLAIVFMELRSIGTFTLTDERKSTILLGLGVLIFLSFQFYRPLTYNEPISDRAFERRSLMRMWELKCVRCAVNSPLVIPGT